MSLTTGLLGYWKLGTNSNDSLGVLNGTDHNITYSSNYANFNGSSSYIDLGNGTNASTGLTFDGVVNTSTPTTNQMFFQKTNGTSAATDSYYLFYYNSSGTMKFQFFVGDGSSNVYVDFVYTLSANTDYYLAVTYDLSNAKFYVNGSLVSTVALSRSSINTNASSVYIGAFNAGGSPVLNWNGKIKEVGLWDRPLTTTELSDRYASGSILSYPFSSSPTPNALFFSA